MRQVGDAAGLLAQLRAEASGAAVALGLDCPIGLPRDYAAHHAEEARDFPSFLRTLASRPAFFDVAAGLPDVAPGRPFYPARPLAGMTRAAHAAALGLSGAAALSRHCDRATAERPAGAPLFWTLGANQTGKAALHAWREVLIPALNGDRSVTLWLFAGPFLSLLRPGGIAVAECYPAEAMRHLDVRPIGSKRRRTDRLRLIPALRAAMATLRAMPDANLEALLRDGFGEDATGEDKLDCLLGVLGTLNVVQRRRTDAAPDDPWVQRWEGWVLGQTSCPILAGETERSLPIWRGGEMDAEPPKAREP